MSSKSILCVSAAERQYLCYPTSRETHSRFLSLHISLIKPLKHTCMIYPKDSRGPSLYIFNNILGFACSLFPVDFRRKDNWRGPGLAEVLWTLYESGWYRRVTKARLVTVWELWQDLWISVPRGWLQNSVCIYVCVWWGCVGWPILHPTLYLHFSGLICNDCLSETLLLVSYEVNINWQEIIKLIKTILWVMCVF